MDTWGNKPYLNLCKKRNGILASVEVYMVVYNGKMIEKMLNKGNKITVKQEISDVEKCKNCCYDKSFC